MRTLEERFWEKVDKTATCWNWTAGTNYGYGMISVGGRAGRPRAAHRVSFALANGPIPEGVDIDHKCHNRACVNPDHLQAVSRKENLENLDPAQFKSPRGVYWHKAAGKWVVSVSHNNKSVYGGLYADKGEAVARSIELRNSLYTNNLADRRRA